MIKTLLSFATAALGFMSTVNAEEVWDNGVLVLGDDSFDEAIAKYDYLLVEFYAPWCGHCKKLQPEYEAAAEVLRTQEAPGTEPRTIAKVDCTTEKKLAERMEIKGYPTLYFFKQGEKEKYSGKRTKDGIVEWVNTNSVKTSTGLDCDTLQEKMGSTATAMGYFGEEDTKLWQIFQKSMKNPMAEMKYEFYHTNDAECASKYGATAPAIVVQRIFDESPVIYDGAIEGREFVSWAKTTAEPSQNRLTEDYIKKVFIDKEPAIMLFDADLRTTWSLMFNYARKEIGDQIHFIMADFKDMEQDDLVSQAMRLKDHDLPIMLILDPANMVKYKMPHELNTVFKEDIIQFVQDFKNGKLRPYVQSQKLDKPEENGLKQIIGNKWDQYVYDTNKDVLVLIWQDMVNDWTVNATCQNFMDNVWKPLAKEVEDIENVMIASFNINSNELHHLAVNSLPTVKYYPMTDKSFVGFDVVLEDIETMTMQPFIDFLSEYSDAYKAARPQAEGSSGEQAEQTEL